MKVEDIDIELLKELWRPFWKSKTFTIKILNHLNVRIDKYNNIVFINGNIFKLDDYLLAHKIKQRENKLNFVLNES